MTLQLSHHLSPKSYTANKKQTRAVCTITYHKQLVVYKCILCVHLGGWGTKQSDELLPCTSMQFIIVTLLVNSYCLKLSDKENRLYTSVKKDCLSYFYSRREMFPNLTSQLTTGFRFAFENHSSWLMLSGSQHMTCLIWLDNKCSIISHFTEIILFMLSVVSLEWVFSSLGFSFEGDIHWSPFEMGCLDGGLLIITPVFSEP